MTVLFADLVGFTCHAEQMDPEDVRAVLSPYYARLRAELERFGGRVEKFIGDAVMALFGAPASHEDDPERAVRAALAIRDWAQDEQIQVRLAVNTGGALITLGTRPWLTRTSCELPNPSMPWERPGRPPWPGSAPLRHCAKQAGRRRLGRNSSPHSISMVGRRYPHHPRGSGAAGRVTVPLNDG